VCITRLNRQFICTTTIPLKKPFAPGRRLPNEEPQSWVPVITTLALSVAAANVSAKVTEAEAAKLGKELTCVGAEAGPNKDGTIPAFSGKWLGTPPASNTRPTWASIRRTRLRPTSPCS
jgi:hypothetical protein